jgi:hypothetical protein
LYDFEAVVIPFDKNYSNMVFKPKTTELSQKTINIMRRMFEQLFECRQGLEHAKNTLQINKVDLNDVFRELDFTNKGYLTIDNIHNFADTNQCKFDRKQLELFFQRCCTNEQGNAIDFRDFYIYFSV